MRLTPSLLLSLSLVIALPSSAEAIVMSGKKPRGNYQSTTRYEKSYKERLKEGAKAGVVVGTYARMEIPKTGVSVQFPHTWTYDNLRPSSLMTDVKLYPKGESDAGWTSVVVKKQTKAMTLPDIDAFFDHLSGIDEQNSLSGDWYIPSMNKLQRSDATVAGIAGRRFDYETTWGGGLRIGATVIVYRDGTLYEFWGRAPEELWKKDVSGIYEHLLKTATIETVQSSSVSSASKVRKPAASSSSKEGKQSSSASSSARRSGLKLNRP